MTSSSIFTRLIMTASLSIVGVACATAEDPIDSDQAVSGDSRIAPIDDSSLTGQAVSNPPADTSRTPLVSCTAQKPPFSHCKVTFSGQSYCYVCEPGWPCIPVDCK